MGSQESSPPYDVVFEILTRLKSLETLDTCKLVCKGWEEMIYESSFMPLYCYRSRMLSGFFIQDMVDNKFFSMFAAIDGSTSSNVFIARLPDDMKILASCNHGILCCVRRSGKNYRYYVCKPTTQQWQSLPNPKLRYETVSVAVMVLGSDPFRYKIVRSFKEYYTYRCEIFDSKTWRWREVERITVRYTEIIIDSVTANNVVYWLTSEDNVIAFHEADELLYKFSLPEKVVQKSDLYKCKRLVEYKGRLGLTFLIEEGKMTLWPTRDSRTTEWMREEKEVMVIDTENLEKHVQYPSLVGFYNAGIAFLKGFHEVVFYRFGDHESLSRVELDHRLRDAREVFQFRSDLEPVRLGRVS
ncbi:UNVERIFIED_CONTAM: F-box protein [Sesamum radiatum]|uniref:F-box protein n=1 Tax=Sesamum radiatum TaxID=300843 RepID=A0AAW2TUE8_SESRA